MQRVLTECKYCGSLSTGFMERYLPMQYYTLTEIYANTARKNISAVHTALTDGTSTLYLSNILVVQSFPITYL